MIAEGLELRGQEGYTPHEMGVFIRSQAQLDAIAAIKAAGCSAVDLAQHAGGVSGNVAVGTMRLAKGLEFRAVVVTACDDEVLPSQARIERVGDQAELDEVYATERHRLYVACTRARDHLLVTGVEPESEFLDDLLVEHQRPALVALPVHGDRVRVCPSRSTTLSGVPRAVSTAPSLVDNDIRG